MELLNNIQYIFFHLCPTSGHPYPPQGENYDRNSRLVVDEDDNSKFRLERVIKYVYKNQETKGFFSVVIIINVY